MDQAQPDPTRWFETWAILARLSEEARTKVKAGILLAYSETMSTPAKSVSSTGLDPKLRTLLWIEEIRHREERDWQRLSFFARSCYNVLAGALLDAGLLTFAILSGTEVLEVVCDASMSCDLLTMSAHRFKDCHSVAQPWPNAIRFANHWMLDPRWQWRPRAGMTADADGIGEWVRVEGYGDTVLPYPAEKVRTAINPCVCNWQGKLLLKSTDRINTPEDNAAGKRAHRKRARGPDAEIEKLKIAVRRMHADGLSQIEMCSRLSGKPRPPFVAWRHLDWPAAYRHPKVGRSVKKWLSVAAASSD